MHREILFSEKVIAERVTAMAHQIAAAPIKPQIASPILVGAYVFASDLLRALAREGLSLPTEFLWLRSYIGRTATKGISVLVGPNENFRDKNVLLIDGVLDGGHTLKKAREIALEHGARSIQSAVMVDKLRPDAVVKADYAAFTGVTEFIVGYGMDDAGADRALPYIAKAGLI
ncbi:MAG: phosphoribosyltransferase family protein [Rhizomicrobium sp.]|jgi:hypoxanthine phosphoribosyltransferase